jgi:hypothetical protein
MGVTPKLIIDEVDIPHPLINKLDICRFVRMVKCGKPVPRLDESFLVKEEQSPDETEDKIWDNKEAEDSGTSKIRLFFR